MEVEDTLSTVSSNRKTSNDTIKTETSGSSNFVLRPSKRMRSFTFADDAFPNAVAAAIAVAAASAGPTRFKGVVQQQNGHWGAQIYADHKRIWLGTFKTACEAAMAYDSAAIKLRNGDPNSHRNFPWTEFSIHEPDFQECYTTEAVLNMIRDGSYQHKFRDFLRIRSQILASMNGVGVRGGHGDQETGKYFSCAQLFQKELTPSDVGKLNRLVIPKKYAVKYLPYISDHEKENEGVEDVELVFYDRTMRQWKFRYCYWRSSQSFVFTRGWNGFVKEKNLKEKDVIIFYTCEVPSNNVKTMLEGNQIRNFLMIDVNYFEETGFVVPNEAPETKQREDSGADLNLAKVFGFKLQDETKAAEEETGSETGNGMVENKGFMLFGVRIQ